MTSEGEQQNKSTQYEIKQFLLKVTPYLFPGDITTWTTPDLTDVGPFGIPFVNIQVVFFALFLRYQNIAMCHKRTLWSMMDHRHDDCPMRMHFLEVPSQTG
jgi:hypothetical protein